MNRTKKSIAILLALIMCLSVLTIGGFAADDDLLANVEGKLVIIHTNDVHGRDLATSGSYGTAAVSQLKKDFTAAGAKVLLLSAGDASQGTPLVNYDQGATAINFMSAAGYNAMSPGNHEFDWGAQNLFDILKDATFPVLAANILYTEGNEYGGKAGDFIFDANKIFQLDGLKVGVFGLTTPETYTKAHPDKVKGIEFLQGEALINAAKKQVSFLKGEGCDVVICLGHLGVSDESKGNRSYDIISAVDGIDLFVDGHSHTVFQNGQQEKNTLVVSTGEYLARIGVVIFDPAEKTFTASLLGITDGVKAYSGVDEELNAIINARSAEVEDALKVSIGTTGTLLLGVQPQIRTIETNLGNFATDALLWSARKVLGEDKVDAAITNGGGIRASIPTEAGAAFPYNITMKDMQTVFPFGNTVATVELTGAQLLEALEAATFSSPGTVGAFPQVSGIEFEIHNYIPYERGDQYAGSTYFAPANPGSRVKNVIVGGEPLDIKKTYVIATNDFTAAGGDTYAVFKAKSGGINLGIAMEQALIDYLAEELGGVVGADYTGPQGRIKVYYMDIVSTEWYLDAVTYAFKNSLIDGTITNSWEPHLAVTRAVAFEALYRLEGSPDVEGENFTDVSKDASYYNAALWAKNTGVSEGIAGEFRGGSNITRSQLAAIFVRYLETIYKYEFTPFDLAQYTDQDQIQQWAVDENVFAKIVGTGIIQGVSLTRLSPNSTAQRCQLAQMLLNMADYITDKVAEADSAA